MRSEERITRSRGWWFREVRRGALGNGKVAMRSAILAHRGDDAAAPLMKSEGGMVELQQDVGYPPSRRPIRFRSTTLGPVREIEVNGIRRSRDGKALYSIPCGGIVLSGEGAWRYCTPGITY